MSRVAGKVAIITGAASGLGYAAAVKLLSEGAKVVLSDINEEVINTMPDLFFLSLPINLLFILWFHYQLGKKY